jgi:integrase
MPRKKNPPAGHTGRTEAGHTRDVKVERVGKVTIYQRGERYYLYYREGRVTQRRKVDGNLAVARATAHRVVTALNDGRASPVAYHRTAPEAMVAGYLSAVASVQRLALRTQDRYRAALDRFLDFCKAARIAAIDGVEEATVEDFVRWLGGQKRTRNGAGKGKRGVYQPGGVKFILSTCRTAFNWAGRHRMLPPFAENPFILFGVDKLKDTAGPAEERLFTSSQERAFFAACDGWQRPVFSVLAGYGLRAGELTHLLIEDVDLVNDVFVVRSKPWMFWTVKTGRERRLPLLPGTKELFVEAIGDRKAGFVFLNKEYVLGPRKPAHSFSGAQGFQSYLGRAVADLLAWKPDAGERELKRAVVKRSRTVGQIPEKRLRCEFMELTGRIGCPEFTRVHDLRHLFASRAQAADINPILVQEMLGHTTLEMTRRYTHLGMETKRDALRRLAQTQPVEAMAGEQPRRIDQDREQATGEGLPQRQAREPLLHVCPLSPPRKWGDIWDDFLTGHRAWWDRHKPGPAYLLPEPVVRHLARTSAADGDRHRAGRALISQDDAAAENAFRGVCERYGVGTVGVWDEQPVQFGLLHPPEMPTITKELMSQLGWDNPKFSNAIPREIEELGPRAGQAHHRLLGHVGYLTFHKEYQAGRQSLEERWLALPTRPPFPLRAGLRDQTFDVTSAEVSRFLDDTVTFLRRWDLVQLVTWELPLPQGPVDAVPLGPATQLLGPDQLVSTVPAYYDVPSSEDEREATRQRQKQAAEMAGLKGDYPLAGLGGRGDSAGTNESAYRLWLIESAVRSRFGAPKGLAARLISAFEEILGCGPVRVNQLRGIYLPFLRSGETGSDL